MARLGSAFDATEVEPNGSFEPVPAGEYRAHIIASEEKTNKAETGSYFELKLEIIDGEQSGRQVIERLNINNPNEKAVEIAYRTLSAICHAAGKLNVQDTEELHNIPMLVKVAVTPPRGDYGPGNEIKGYKPDNGGAKPATGRAKPWVRK